MMTKDREEHLAGILARFNKEFELKYMRGQNEHGGALEDRDCLEEAAQEALDLVAYLTCERVKKQQMIDLLSGWDLNRDGAVEIVRELRQLYGLDKP